MSGHLLLCRARGARNSYLPGGHVEFRERAKVALAREIAEEMGEVAHVGRFLGAVEHTFLQKGKSHAEINLLFRMTVRGLRPDRLPTSREDWIGFEWCPLARLSRAKLEPAVLRRALPRWLEHGRGAPWGSTRHGWLD